MKYILQILKYEYTYYNRGSQTVDRRQFQSR